LICSHAPDVAACLGPAPAPPACSHAAPACLPRAQIELPRDDLYLPTNPASRVLAALPESATPMQSAAKVPLLVAFQARAARLP